MSGDNILGETGKIGIMRDIAKKGRAIAGKIKGVKVSPAARDVLLGTSVGLVVAILSTIGVFQKFEYVVLDTLFKMRGERDPARNIVIVGIDDGSLEKLGRWPWPRSYHASFLQILNQFEPKAVVFDILFPESDPEGDPLLAEVAKRKKNLYLAFHFELYEGSSTQKREDVAGESLSFIEFDGSASKKLLSASGMSPPVDILRKAAKRICAINAPSDEDGSTRHLPLLIKYGGLIYPTLSLQLACDYFGVGAGDIRIERDTIVIPRDSGDIRIPIDPAGRLMLNYDGPIERFTLYSYKQLLRDYSRSLNRGTKGILDDIRDKIVFVGHMATGSVDLRVMPFSNIYPAVGVHATALSNILRGNMMREAGRATNALAILFVSMMLGVLTRRGQKMFVNLSLMVFVFSGYAMISFLLFTFLRYWVFTFAPLLAVFVSYVVIAIGHYETVRYEKKIIEKELIIAHKIQQSFLPKSYPNVPFLEFAARCMPAKHIGGDMYDFVELGDDKIGIVIGDVSGKGVPAALYMARAVSEFRTRSRMTEDVASTLSALNDSFAGEGMEKSFITMQYVMIDLKSRNVVFSNGGHNTILHYVKRNHAVEELDTSAGMPIGIMEGAEFEIKEISFEKGDILFLYTDGISEAMNKRRKEFGVQRVKEIVLRNSEASASEVLSRVLDEISVFSRGAPQHDDMTLIIIKAV